jgi:hypothetical protein
MARWLRIRSDFGFPEAAVRERQERMSSGDELDEALGRLRTMNNERQNECVA